MKTLLLVVSALVIIALFVGCAPQASAPPPKPSPPPPAPAPAPVPAPSPTAAPKPAPSPSPAQPAIKTGGTLNTWSMVAPAHWDLQRKPSYGPLFGQPVFNNLVQFDPNKSGIGPDVLQPDLAEKWLVSPDGREYTFNLRKGVKWHDGKPFTADDVVFSIEKMMDPKRSSVYGDFPSYDKVQRVDDFTVKVTLKYPSPSFLIMLAGAYAVVEPKHLANVDMRSTDFLVGTGPFKFKKYDAGVKLELVKNPDYFKKDASGRQMPYLDALNVFIFSDKSAVLDALVTGRLDGHTSFALNTQDEWDRVVSKEKRINAVMYSPPGLGLHWRNPNFTPFKDQRVRRAMDLLMDRKAMTIAAYGNENWSDTKRAIFPDPYGLPDAELLKLRGEDMTWDARVAEAKKLMADAGYAQGFNMRFVGRTLNVTELQYSWLADQYKKHLNINASIVLREINESRKMRDNMDYEVFSDNPLVNLGEPDEYISWFMTGGVNNFVKTGNPEADKLWQAESREMDPAKRTKLTQEIERIVIKDSYITTVTSTKYTAAWWDYVKGFYPQPLIYSAKQRMETIWLNK